MQTLATFFWRRLDVPGHDACRLERHGDAWRLDGAAVFRLADGRPAWLSYRVHCDKAWHTDWGRVRGWIGAATIDVALKRHARDGWTVNDVPVPEVAHCVDLDLGFTPATHLIALRRLHLAPGEQAENSFAWFDTDAETLSPMKQRYERRSDTEYSYEVPHLNDKAVLRVTPEGWVTNYPTLWEMEGQE